MLDQASDVISGVTTSLPDEGPGNTIGHHSYYAVWLWVEDAIELPVGNWEEKYKALTLLARALSEGL